MAEPMFSIEKKQPTVPLPDKNINPLIYMKNTDNSFVEN